MTLFVYIYVILWIIGGIIALTRCIYNSFTLTDTADGDAEYDIDVSD